MKIIKSTVGIVRPYYETVQKKIMFFVGNGRH